jgi:hypothetical protein
MHSDILFFKTKHPNDRIIAWTRWARKLTRSPH